MGDIGHPAVFGAEEEELRALLRHQEATGRLGLSALAGAELDSLLAQAAGEVAATLRVEYCEVLELTPEGDRLLLRAGVGWKDGRVGAATVGTGLESQAGYTLISRGPVVVEDLVAERRFTGSPLLQDHGVKSGITVTIRTGGRPYGVLGAHTGKNRPFYEDEISFLREVSDVLGAAIERKREESDTRSLLGERTRWAVEAERRFAFLSEANARLSASTDPPTVLDTAVRLAVPELAGWCAVDVVEEVSGSVARLAIARRGAYPAHQSLLELSGHYPLSPDAPHGTPRVWKTGRPQLLPAADEETLMEITGQPDILEGPASYLCVPLRVGGRTLGSVGFVSPDEDEAFWAEAEPGSLWLQTQDPTRRRGYAFRRRHRGPGKRARGDGGFGAYPNDRAEVIETSLEHAVGASGGRLLGVVEAHKAWGEKFYPVAPSRHAPEIVREFVSLRELGSALEARSGAPVQCTVSSSGETLLLALGAG